MMEISEEGLKLIESSEGLRLEAYKDGGGVWTIGYGHTRGVKEGDKITEEQAEIMLKADVQSAVKDVNHLVQVPLTQGQFDALVDFTFNLGEPALSMSTLLQKLNTKDYESAKYEFCKWNHDNGKVVEGLTIRRKKEEVMFT